MRSPARTRVLCLAAVVVAAAAVAGRLPAEEFEAISSRAASDYVRTKRPDGTYQIETYAFGKGGYWSGPVSDKTIDKLDFMDVAHVIALPLAAQHYLPAKDPKSTRLLIMVYWGTSYAPEHTSESAAYQNAQQATDEVNNAVMQGVPAAVLQSLEDEEMMMLAEVQRENRRRDNENFRNAKMLGYDSWWDATFNAHTGTPQELEKRDMMDELEEDRYFVVLMAYDFQILQAQKKHKLLWETRFSIRERNHAFDKQLPAMVLKASSYFGKDSGGLFHDKLPEGQVDIGDLKDLGEAPAK